MLLFPVFTKYSLWTEPAKEQPGGEIEADLHVYGENIFPLGARKISV